MSDTENDKITIDYTNLLNDLHKLKKNHAKLEQNNEILKKKNDELQTNYTNLLEELHKLQYTLQNLG